MAVYAIGDVQGCRASLERLLERVRYDPVEDTLWFCGDLVNRGSDSLGVLRFVRKLGDRAVVVLGNHDLHLVAAARDPGARRKSDTFDDVLAAPDATELVAWLRRRPLLHHDASLGYTLVHAGLPPQWDLERASECARELERALAGDAGDFLDAMYGDEPDLWSDDLAGPGRLRYICNCFTRLRFVTSDGRVALGHKGAPGTQPGGQLPWFEHPGRRSRELHVVFGHWSTLERRGGAGVYPLDSGCVWGGKLTALRLDGDGGWFSVDCPQARQPG